MEIGFWAEGITCVILVAVAYWKRHGMKEYVVLWLFAALFSDVIGIAATQHLHLWRYPGGIFYGIGLWFIGDDILIPTAAMLVIRYWPKEKVSAIVWTLACTAGFTLFEYSIERYTNLIKYEDGYQWYYSFFIWLVFLIICRLFQNWFYPRRVYHAS